MRGIWRRDEPEEIYLELIKSLADSAVPMVILCLLVVTIASYVLTVTQSPIVAVAAALVLLASLVKTGLILWHRRALRSGWRGEPSAVRRLEAMHAASTLMVSTTVGLFTATIFALPEIALHLTATSVLFGYCAGVINRVSVRPRIAIGALLCAGVPGTIAAASGGTTSHLILALVFAGFLAGAIQTVSYAYETARRSVALQLGTARLARQDPLTGLLNRVGLHEAIDALAGSAQPMAVHVFDLDGFKSVNDRFGHAAGDRVLTILSDRLRTMLPAGTIAARVGGDEFVLVQSGTGGARPQARRLAEAVHRQLTRACDLGDERRVSVGLSLGAVMGDMTCATFDALIRQADDASYAVKRSGGGVLMVGDPVPTASAPRAARSA